MGAIAASTSTSGSTIPASLPPNSRVRCFSVWEADSKTRRPVCVDPVNEILSASGCDVIQGPTLSPSSHHVQDAGRKNIPNQFRDAQHGQRRVERWLENDCVARDQRWDDLVVRQK